MLPLQTKLKPAILLLVLLLLEVRLKLLLKNGLLLVRLLVFRFGESKTLPFNLGQRPNMASSTTVTATSC